MGHSFIYWASTYAAKMSWGHDLQLGASAWLEWRGWRGMLWEKFNEVADPGASGSPPDILLIHLGCKMTWPKGVASLLCWIHWGNLQSWKTRYPMTRIVWSMIILTTAVEGRLQSTLHK